MQYYTDIFRFSLITILILLGLLIAQSRKKDQNTVITLLFISSIGLYSLSDWEPGMDTWAQYIFQLGGFSIPFLFWLFSKSIFDDGFIFKKKYLLVYSGAFLATFGAEQYINSTEPGPTEDMLFIFMSNLHQYVSLIFIVLGLVEALKNKNDDLLESRIKFRSIFIIVVAVIIGITLLAEITLNRQQLTSWPNFFQKGTILFLTFYFAVHILQLKSGFFIEYKKAEAPVALPDPAVETALTSLIVQDKIFLQEGLTIRLLSEKIGEKEYKVRQYINQHLGFKNFNDFLNSHRIQEACEILLDKQKNKLTILEIAYQLGYSSIGPFNNAFKKHTGTTPTLYRKNA